MVRLVLWTGILWAVVGLVFGAWFSYGRREPTNAYVLIYHIFDGQNTVIHRWHSTSGITDVIRVIPAIAVEDLAVSPNGQWLAYAGYDVSTATRSFYLTHMAGTFHRRVVEVEYDLAFSIAWSANGQTVAFSHAPPDDYITRVYQMHPHAKTPQPLLAIPYDAPYLQWSADGKHLAYQLYGGDEPIQVAMNLTDADAVPVALSFDRDADLPRWSPDGQWLAFTEYTPSNTRIYKMRPDGSERTLIVTHDAIIYELQWSMDSQWLVFSDNRLYRVRADGSALQPLTEPLNIHSGVHWSPDNNALFFVTVGYPNASYIPHYSLHRLDITSGTLNTLATYPQELVYFTRPFAYPAYDWHLLPWLVMMGLGGGGLLVGTLKRRSV